MNPKVDNDVVVDAVVEYLRQPTAQAVAKSFMYFRCVPVEQRLAAGNESITGSGFTFAPMWLQESVQRIGDNVTMDPTLEIQCEHIEPSLARQTPSRQCVIRSSKRNS